MKSNIKWSEKISTIMQPFFQLDFNLRSKFIVNPNQQPSATFRILMIVNIYYNCRLITGKMLIDFFPIPPLSFVLFFLLIFILSLRYPYRWTVVRGLKNWKWKLVQQTPDTMRFCSIRDWVQILISSRCPPGTNRKKKTVELNSHSITSFSTIWKCPKSPKSFRICTQSNYL